MSDTKANLKKWSEAWEKAGVTIQEEWEARLTAPDYHANTMAQFADMFNYAVENSTPTATSGLIEMQKYFMKLRPRSE
ncbi:MAG: hypothetical protein HBSAPP04_22430 [Ignavibacteriaceae bacterium]|nr:MAG: hypothetical protein EDM75_03090 [Chlorobiota bacterium]GJQ33404.1 MAG: hypothetical protein HBSAPP04_22430 [Ignavibacteriaceae bacterium]